MSLPQITLLDSLVVLGLVVFCFALGIVLGIFDDDRKP